MDNFKLLKKYLLSNKNNVVDRSILKKDLICSHLILETMEKQKSKV